MSGKNYIIILIVIILTVGLTGVFVLQKLLFVNSMDFAKPIGDLRVSANSELQSNINSYMESQKDENYLGKENYHCANILYGYDDKYAYAWVICSGFISKGGELKGGTGSSAPTRLEYSGSDFQIIGFREPADASSLDPTLRELFPEKFYQLGRPSNTELEKLDKEVINKAQLN
jgi:hypothetical protein